MSRKRLVCPACGERAGVRIVWGLPMPDAFDDPDVAIGGCVVPRDPTDTRCQACGHGWVARRAE